MGFGYCPYSHGDGRCGWCGDGYNDYSGNNKKEDYSSFLKNYARGMRLYDDPNASVKSILRTKIIATTGAISIIKEFSPESTLLLTLEGIKQGLEIALREIK